MVDKTDNIEELKQQNYVSMKKLKNEINKLKDKCKNVKHPEKDIRRVGLITE